MILIIMIIMITIIIIPTVIILIVNQKQNNNVDHCFAPLHWMFGILSSLAYDHTLVLPFTLQMPNRPIL